MLKNALPVNCRSWRVHFLIQDAALKFIVLQRKIYLHIIMWEEKLLLSSTDTEWMSTVF